MSTIGSALRLPLRRPRASAAPRHWLPGYLLCAPALLLVLGLLAYPVLFDLRLSLTDASGFVVDGRFVGLANYVRIFTDPGYWIAARNTVLLIGGVAAVE